MTLIRPERPSRTGMAGLPREIIAALHKLPPVRLVGGSRQPLWRFQAGFIACRDCTSPIDVTQPWCRFGTTLTRASLGVARMTL